MIKHLRPLILSTCLLATQRGWAADEAASCWIRHATISPDGAAIAFALGGQLWLVGATGGEATPLTSGEFYSTRPVWSPDGKTIAFACKRNGHFDVFATPADGGTPLRLTHHAADDLPYAFSADGRGIFFGSSRIGSPESELVGSFQKNMQLYTVPATGGVVKLVLPTAALDVAVSPDGKTLVYDNCPVYENEWRKGAVSDGTRDLWLHEPATGKHRQLTRNRGEDRDGESGWFENSETVPDVPVYNAPEDVAAGRDPQLDAAIDRLLKELPPSGGAERKPSGQEKQP
jgi:tricorn protease